MNFKEINTYFNNLELHWELKWYKNMALISMQIIKPNFLQEIWDMINQKLLSLNAVKAAKIFKFRVEPQVEKQAAVWNTIFQHIIWLDFMSKKGINSIFIKSKLFTYKNADRIHSISYAVLFVDDWSGNFMHFNPKHQQLFFNCLQPYKFNLYQFYEIIFHLRICFNVTDAFKTLFAIFLNVESLF